jgi:predicted transposase YbfD/YdcC
VRGHWSVENNLHWVLDVAFREDESRVRKEHGPENLGLLRRIALSLLKRAPSRKKCGVAAKRKQAGWNDDFLVEVLLGQPG